jgi:hypothetical protein
MNLTDFHAWLCKETPARADEITSRLEILHKFMPQSYADWPRGSLGVSEALTALEVKGLVRKQGADWVWVSAAKVEPQMALFV